MTLNERGYKRTPWLLLIQGLLLLPAILNPRLKQYVKSM